MKKFRRIMVLAIIILLYSCSNGCISEFSKGWKQSSNRRMYARERYAAKPTTKEKVKDTNTKVLFHIGNIQAQHLLKILLR